MNKEIYIRRPNISNYNKNDIEVTDLLEQFLQQIEMVLSTPPTTVLGNNTFGVGLQEYIHTFNTNETDLKNVINRQISTNCSLSGEFSYQILVEFYQIGQSDSAIIDIVVENDNLVRIVV